MKIIIKKTRESLISNHRLKSNLRSRFEDQITINAIVNTTDFVNHRFIGSTEKCDSKTTLTIVFTTKNGIESTELLSEIEAFLKNQCALSSNEYQIDMSENGPVLQLGF